MSTATRHVHFDPEANVYYSPSPSVMSISLPSPSQPSFPAHGLSHSAYPVPGSSSEYFPAPVYNIVPVSSSGPAAYRYESPESSPESNGPPTPPLHFAPTSPYPVHANARGTPYPYNAHLPAPLPVKAEKKETRSSRSQVTPLPQMYPSPPSSNSSNSLYSQAPPQIALHPLLSPPSASAPGQPTIVHDLSLPFDPLAIYVTYPPSPRGSSSIGGPVLLEPHHLLAPATHPPVASLRIVADALPWPIDVVPSTTTSPPRRADPVLPIIPYVTVADVLSQMYSALRHPVTQAEYASLEAGVQRRVSESYHGRYTRCAAAAGNGGVGGGLGFNGMGDAGRYEEEKRKGVKRVDWLMGKTRFGGLVGLAGEGGGKVVWKLVVG